MNSSSEKTGTVLNLSVLKEMFIKQIIYFVMITPWEKLVRQWNLPGMEIIMGEIKAI